MQNYRGGCHCGRVRFEVSAALPFAAAPEDGTDRIEDCNCSICTKKGYLHPGASSGVWDTSSIAALKKFQEDQNLEPSGKLDSLSLIALGLGPRRDSQSGPQP